MEKSSYSMSYTILLTLDHDYLIIGFDGSNYNASIIRTGWNPHTLSAINFNFCDPVDKKLIPRIFKDHYWTKKRFTIHFPISFESDRDVYLDRRNIPKFNLFDGTHKEFIRKLELTGFDFSCFNREISISEFNPDLDYLFYGKSVQRKSNLLLNLYKEKKINYCVLSDYSSVSVLPKDFHLVVYLDSFSKEFLEWFKSVKDVGLPISIVYTSDDYSILDKNRDILDNFLILLKC